MEDRAIAQFIDNKGTETLDRIRKVLVAKLARHLGEGDASQLADEIMLGGIVEAVEDAISDSVRYGASDQD